MRVQLVDLRHSYTHLRFGCDDDRDAWIAECVAARAGMTVPHVVAPRCIVETTRGVLRAGDAIAAEDLAAVVGRDGHMVGAGCRFRRLVDEGAILERDA